MLVRSKRPFKVAVATAKCKFHSAERVESIKHENKVYSTAEEPWIHWERKFLPAYLLTLSPSSRALGASVNRPDRTQGPLPQSVSCSIHSDRSKAWWRGSRDVSCRQDPRAEWCEADGPCPDLSLHFSLGRKQCSVCLPNFILSSNLKRAYTLACFNLLPN